MAFDWAEEDLDPATPPSCTLTGRWEDINKEAATAGPGGQRQVWCRFEAPSVVFMVARDLRGPVRPAPG